MTCCSNAQNRSETSAICMRVPNRSKMSFCTCSAMYWNISVRALRACMLYATAEWSVLGFAEKSCHTETHTHCDLLTLNRKMVHLHLENRSDDESLAKKSCKKARASDCFHLITGDCQIGGVLKNEIPFPSLSSCGPLQSNLVDARFDYFQPSSCDKRRSNFL